MWGFSLATVCKCLLHIIWFMLQVSIKNFFIIVYTKQYAKMAAQTEIRPMQRCGFCVKVTMI